MNIFVTSIAAMLMVLFLSTPVAQTMDGSDLLTGYNSYKLVK